MRTTSPAAARRATPAERAPRPDRDGTLDPTRSGETLRDAGDLIVGDTGVGTIGDGDVITGDNARIQRPLACGVWRIDAQRKDVDAEPGAQLRDVTLFDVQKVGGADGLSADPGESGADTITGNGGEDILLAQANGGTAPTRSAGSRRRRPAELPERHRGPGRARSRRTEE